MDEGIARTRLGPDVGERFLPLRRRLGVTSFGMNQIVLEAVSTARTRLERELDPEAFAR
jgi:hypothetical protein